MTDRTPPPIPFPTLLLVLLAAMASCGDDDGAGVEGDGRISAAIHDGGSASSPEAETVGPMSRTIGRCGRRPTGGSPWPPPRG